MSDAYGVERVGAGDRASGQRSGDSAGAVWSTRTWAGWVNERLAARGTVYEIEPSLLVADSNREVNYTRDYHGRELLELIQNADDAAGALGSNKVAIECTDDGLCFANTGTPFSVRGVESLLMSDHSPTDTERSRYIGNRGLGFRSILNWTSCPFITSGHLRLGFERDHAQRWVHALAQQRPEVRAIIAERLRAGRQMPAPLLAIPMVLDEDGTVGAASDWQPTPHFSATWQRAVALRAEGYDTVIGVPVTTPVALTNVREQLAELAPEVMLFLRNVEELRISLLGEAKPRLWRAEREERVVRIETPRGTRVGDGSYAWGHPN